MNRKLEKKEIKQIKENKYLSAVIYFIIIATVAMIAPLVYKLAEDYSNGRTVTLGDSEAVNERIARNLRRYTVEENTVDLSGLRNTEYGALSLITAKVTDRGEIILFCSGRIEIETSGKNENEEGDEDESEDENKNEIEIEIEPEPEYENIMRIALVKETSEDIIVSSRAVRNNFLESLQNKDYVFKDYADNTFFLSNNKAAFLFDTESMRIAENYVYPQNFNIYQSALSNDKEMLALAAEQGFFVAHPRESNMTLSASNMKELIATVNAGGVITSARDPVWSVDDRRIFYRLYTDNFVRNAGVTASAPGENQHFSSLEANNFVFLNDDFIFYYFLPGTVAGTETSPGNLFRCGYFNVNERKMNEVMRSQVNYFDISVSSNGTHLAALSPNGNMIKISVIDIQTKRLIYSALYNDIYDFSFSPDEKNLVIHGRTDGRRILRVINIDWTEE